MADSQGRPDAGRIPLRDRDVIELTAGIVQSAARAGVTPSYLPELFKEVAVAVREAIEAESSRSKSEG